MGEGRRTGSREFEERHAAIIGRTLRWADEAAARRDYLEALRWVETILSVGDALPDEYDTKRKLWLQALERRGEHAVKRVRRGV